MDAYIAKSLARRTFTLSLIGVFGTLALILATVGVNGVVSYTVSLRTREVVSAIIQKRILLNGPPDRATSSAPKAQIFRPIIRACGGCSQPHFCRWPRSPESVADALDVAQLPDG